MVLARHAKSALGYFRGRQDLAFRFSRARRHSSWATSSGCRARCESSMEPLIRCQVHGVKLVMRLSSFGLWIADSRQSLFYRTGPDFGVLLSPYRKLHPMNLIAGSKKARPGVCRKKVVSETSGWLLLECLSQVPARACMSSKAKPACGTDKQIPSRASPLWPCRRLALDELADHVSQLALVRNS